MIQSIIERYLIDLNTLKIEISSIESDLNQEQFAKIQNCIQSIENTVCYLCETINSFGCIQYNYDVESSHIVRLVDWYNLNKCFNEKNAKKKFINGLIYIILNGYTFDGLYFSKGKEKKHINKIIEPTISNESKQNYIDLVKELKGKK